MQESRTYRHTRDPDLKVEIQFGGDPQIVVSNSYSKLAEARPGQSNPSSAHQMKVSMTLEPDEDGFIAAVLGNYHGENFSVQVHQNAVQDELTNFRAA